MASSCSECNNLFKSQSKIKRWARTKRDEHTRKEGTGTCVRCFNKNHKREQRKNARKGLHSDDEDVDAKTPKTSKLSTPGTNMSSVGHMREQIETLQNILSQTLRRNAILEATNASLQELKGLMMKLQ